MWQEVILMSFAFGLALYGIMEMIRLYFVTDAVVIDVDRDADDVSDDSSESCGDHIMSFVMGDSRHLLVYSYPSQRMFWEFPRAYLINVDITPPKPDPYFPERIEEGTLDLSFVLVDQSYASLEELRAKYSQEKCCRLLRMRF